MLGIAAALATVGVLAATAAGAPRATPQWHTFDAYPGARELCRGRVGPVDWWSYVTTDSPQTVAAFYEAHLGRRERLAPTADKGMVLALRAAGNQVLEVHDLGKSTVYPGCRNKPGVDDRAVVVVTGGWKQPAHKKMPRPDGAARGCGDAVVVAQSADGKRLVRIRLDRRALGLTTRARTFDATDRRVSFYVATYRRPLSYEMSCRDSITPSRSLDKIYYPHDGEITASISVADPKPGQCYKVDLHVEGIVLGAFDLEDFDLKGISVGGETPTECP